MNEKLKQEIIEAIDSGKTADEIEQMIVTEHKGLREDEEARAALWLFAHALEGGSRL